MDSDPEIGGSAFPSIVVPILADNFILVVGQSGSTRNLRLAISTGDASRWNEERTQRLFAVHKMASLNYETSYSEMAGGEIVNHAEDVLTCAKSDDILIYVGNEEIDRWCVELPQSLILNHDVLRLFRLIIALEASAKTIPQLYERVLQRRKKIMEDLRDQMEALQEAPRPEGSGRHYMLDMSLREAFCLGLHESVIFQECCMLFNELDIPLPAFHI
jgi:hypothetical protein